MQSALLDHLDVWTSAVETRSTAGRGSSNKLNLYGIKKLRELILELAVRGQLVPQNPADEPASVLLEKIAAEKARLIKDGKLKKQEPLPPITDDEKPFELPVGWQFVRLGEVTNKIGSGSTPRGGNAAYVDNGIPFLRSQNIINEGLKLTDVVYITEETHKKMQGTKVISQDILLNITGASLGRCALVSDDFGEANVSQHVTIIRSTYPDMRAFLHLSIVSPYVQKMVWGRQVGMAREGLSKKVLEQFEMPIPPEAEQHRIVAKVNELMSLCDALEQEQTANIAAHQTLVEELLAELTSSTPNSPPSLTLPPQGVEGTREKNRAALLLPSPLAGEGLGMGGMPAWARIATHFDTLFTTEHSIDQLKQTILQLAVMGKLVPQDPNDEPASRLLQKIAAEKARLIKEGKLKKEKPLPAITDDEKPFELPDGWEWCRLDDIGELARGKSKHRPRNDPALYLDGNIPLVQTGDVARANVFIETYTALYNQKGLAQSRLWKKGTMCITIAANIADTGILSFDACFPDSVVGFVPLKPEISVRYFDFYIRVMKSHLEEFAPSTAQKNINLEILNQVFVPLPPANELNRIVAKVDELMALCDAMKAQISAAQATQLQLADVLAGQII